MVNSGEFIATSLCQVAFFLIFITTFFFTYATFAEQGTVQSQINFLVDETIGPTLGFACQAKLYDCDSLKEDIIKYLDPDTATVKNDDLVVEKENGAILKKSLLFLGITELIFGIIILLLFYNSKKINSGFFKSFSLKKVLKQSVIILVFVGITEFLFLKYFGSRYMAIDVNAVKIALLEKFKDLIKK